MAAKFERDVDTTWGCPMHGVFPGPVDPLDEMQLAPRMCQLEGVSCVGIDNRLCILNRYDEVVLRRKKQKT